MFDSVNKKTLIVAGSSIIGLLVVIILITFIVGAITPNYLSYDKFEEKLRDAAKNYYNANPSLLPSADGETTLYYSTLEEGGYISSITSLLEKGETCTAQVIVSKYSDNYSYIPYLTCPGDYETKELYKVVLENNKTVTEEAGLYRSSDSYYFRGEIKNNYVQLDKTLWRIVKINSDNSMTIIQTVKGEEYYAWDNRYNVEEEDKTGINDFEVSRIKDTLLDLAKGNTILSDTAKAKLTARNLCVDKRALTDTDSTGSIECTTMSEDKYLLGLITGSEFMAASLDENCVDTSSKACINYNFLATYNYSTWTLTGLTEDTKKVLYYSKNGLRTSTANSEKVLILTAYLSKRAFYESGSGTFDDPYIMK